MSRHTAEEAHCCREDCATTLCHGTTRGRLRINERIFYAQCGCVARRMGNTTPLTIPAEEIEEQKKDESKACNRTDYASCNDSSRRLVLLIASTGRVIASS